MAQQFDLVTMLFKVGMFMIPFLFAISTHEWAHGYVANKLGDPTAKLLGRMTLNPFAHADLLGTFALPILAVVTGAPFFGWAKPVPVNERNLRMKPKVGMFWVALAGPGVNFLMAFGAILVLVASQTYFGSAQFAPAIGDFCKTFLFINLSLAWFNLIPIHPLDGGKIVAIFLPDRWNQKLEEWQPIMSMLLLVFFLTGGLARILMGPVDHIANAMYSFAKLILGVTY